GACQRDDLRVACRLCTVSLRGDLSYSRARPAVLRHYGDPKRTSQKRVACSQPLEVAQWTRGSIDRAGGRNPDGIDAMSNALHTPVCDLLGCKYPVVLAGMGGVARSELVAAVTNAGGFGFLGMVREPPSLIRKEVEAVRRATSQRFGVNLIPAATDSGLLERQLHTCIDLA